MNNQVEPGSFENVHKSQKLKINSNFSSSIHHLSSPFLDVFLPIIGIQLNLSTDIPYPKYISCHRID